MGQSAQPTGTPADLSLRVLAEIENLWTLLRLYGTTHPAFKRGAANAAAALSQPVRVSISPRGFTVGKTALDDPTLATFSHRLRAMGLVGLVMEPGLTAGQVTALVLALDQADRTHLAGAAVVEKLGAATARRVTAIPLRLSGLRLMEGTADEPAAAPEATTVWRDMFAASFSKRSRGAAPDELAESFEQALKSVASPAQWDALVGVWVRQLSAIDPNRPAADDAPGSTAPAGTEAPEPAGTAAPRGDDTLDAAAAFIGALSPHLSRRLLAETLNGQSAPHNVIVALADRLPKGVVLGALAAVDRNNGQPSAAALALLRKIASNLPAAGNPAEASPRTAAEMAEIATSLERLLGSDQEAGFVPDSYLQQRKELSGNAIAPAAGRGVDYPAEHETIRHAAGLAFQILSTPDTPAADVTSALAYVRNRTSDWIKAGEFALAAEGLTLARGLATHWDRAVSKPAAELAANAVSVDDLVEGARQSKHPKDRAAAAEAIAAVLAQLDGGALARALATLKPSAAGGHEAVLDAFRRVLPSLGDENVQGLCKALKDTTPPPALLSVISHLGAADAMKAVGLIIPHASSATRRALVHAVFRNDFRWPLPLTEQLLKDDEAEVRRLAVMKLVSDADLPTAARVFQEASRRGGPFEADVALGLAELLHRHRRHPDVRAAFRQWTWSGRRWAALFSLSLAAKGRAA